MTRLKDSVRIRLTPPAFALIAANLLPVFGVVWLGWDVFPLVFLYWLENGTIGLFTVLRMIVSTSPEPYKLVQKLGLIPFFLIHYGGFWFGHGLFVLSLFGNPGSNEMVQPSAATILDTMRAHDLWFAVVGLVASHAFSFVWNFLVKGEHRRAFIVELNEAPYSRVVVLHVFIILGGFLMLHFHSPALGMLALVALKTVVDLWSHSREHRRQESRMRAYIERMYERVNRPADPGVPDSLQQVFPGYSRDGLAEKQHRRRATRVGCAWVLCIPVGIGVLLAGYEPLAVCIFALSAILLVGAIVWYNFPPRAICRHCHRRMEAVKTGTQLHELPKMQRMQGIHGVKQKWNVCHHCKRYFRHA